MVIGIYDAAVKRWRFPNLSTAKSLLRASKKT